jgi:hypothetical protein
VSDEDAASFLTAMDEALHEALAPA